MKIQVAILILSLAAMAYRTEAQANVVNTTALVPWTGCGGSSPTGLIGICIQIGNLCCNWLLNIQIIISACNASPNGAIIRANCIRIFKAIVAILRILLGGGLTNAHCLIYQLQLNNLIAEIVAVLDGLLGVGTGHSYCCTSANSLLGAILSTIVSVVIGLLGALCSINLQILNGLLDFLLGCCLSCAGSL